MYERYAFDAHRLAYLITGDSGAADDIVQDAFIRVGARLRHVRHRAAFWSYLRRTVVNLAISRSRRMRREEFAFKRMGDAARIEQGHARIDEHLDMLARIEALPPTHRTVVVLRFYEDLTVAEIAGTLHTSEGTVRSWLSRALRALGQEIEKEV
jgi:RNA polymerase sigma-70 factor (sigma-E family)